MNRHNPPFHPHGNPHCPPEQKNGLARTREMDRRVLISDNIGNLNYIVSFNEGVIDTDEGVKTVWVVKVLVPSPEGEEVTLYDSWSDDYEIAAKDYRRNVETYENLVKSQCRHVDDISLYADRIGYRKMDIPPCCWTCAYSFTQERMGHCHNVDWNGMAKGKMRCHCPDLFRLFSRDGVDVKDIMDGRTDRNWLDVKPLVDPDGVCRNYRRREENDIPSPIYPPPHQPHSPHDHVFGPEIKKKRPDGTMLIDGGSAKTTTIRYKG